MAAHNPVQQAWPSACVSLTMNSQFTLHWAVLLALQSSGSRKLLWGGFFGGNWGRFFTPRENNWGWSMQPQQEQDNSGDSSDDQEASPAPSASPSPSPSAASSPSPAPAKDTSVKSEEVAAPADSSKAQGENKRAPENNAGTRRSNNTNEPAAEAQGGAYKLADGTILLHTKAQV